MSFWRQRRRRLAISLYTSICATTNSDICKVIHNLEMPPWSVKGVFRPSTSWSITLHFGGAKCIPENGIASVNLSMTDYARWSSSKRSTISSGYSKSTSLSPVMMQTSGFWRPSSVRFMISSMTKLKRTETKGNLDEHRLCLKSFWIVLRTLLPDLVFVNTVIGWSSQTSMVCPVVARGNHASKR